MGQQFREGLPGAHLYRFVIHDQDTIFSKDIDQGLANQGVQVLRRKNPRSMIGTLTLGPDRPS